MNRQNTALSVIILLIAFSFLGTYSLESNSKADKPPKNIILVSFDTLRGDRVSAAGYNRNITPNMDEFIENSYYFRNAYSNAPWTLPSHSTVFTGQYPSQNGALTWKYKLCENTTTLAEHLQSSDYKTVSFNGDAAIDSSLNFDQGFDNYDSKNLRFSDNYKKSLKWLENTDGKKFLFLHGYDVHAPYLLDEQQKMLFGANYTGNIPDREKEFKTFLENRNSTLAMTPYWKTVNQSSKKDVQHLEDMYDNNIYYLDQNFGKFMQGLKDRGLYEDSLIIVFSDHGEQFNEHGELRHSQFYSENIKILAAMKLPNQEKSEIIEKRVELRDIYPTILRSANMDPNTSAISLQKIVDDAEHKSIFGERMSKEMIVEENYKLIRKREAPWSYKLYNLKTDPNETINLASEKQEKLEQLNQSLNRYPERNYSQFCNRKQDIDALYRTSNFLETLD